MRDLSTILPVRLPGVLLTTLALVAGTATAANAAGEPLHANVVMANSNGGPIDPESFREMEPQEFQSYLDDVFEGISRFCNGESEDRKGAAKLSPCPVLLYFHGGLNTRSGAVGRARQLTPLIRKADTYPIFVNWDSSLPKTWLNHVARLTKGYRPQGTLGVLRGLATPYYIASDEVRAVAQAPAAWLAEVRHTFPSYQAAGKAELQEFSDLVRLYRPGTENSVEVQAHFLEPGTSRLRDDRSAFDKWSRYLSLIPTLPTKILAPPLVVQPAGAGAWDALQRHSQLLFRTEGEFRGARPESLAKARENEAEGGTAKDLEQQADYEAALAQTYDTGAALAQFINRFQDKFVQQFCKQGAYERPKPQSASADPQSQSAGADVKPKATVESKDTPQCKHPVELTLVGHSMGTLIIDQLLRYRADVEVANIVFMAAATSVADYTDTIHPYLERHKGEDGHEKTQMYHLVLHPMAETTERGFLDFSPRGSLLIWIDNYFTDPITPRDRRVGRFSNLVPELRFANSVAGQIHLKVFEVGSKDRCWNPQKHGDFGEFPFWEERFWSPATALNDEQREDPPRRRDEKGCPKRP